MLSFLHAMRQQQGAGLYKQEKGDQPHQQLVEKKLLTQAFIEQGLRNRKPYLFRPPSIEPNIPRMICLPT